MGKGGWTLLVVVCGLALASRAAASGTCTASACTGSSPYVASDPSFAVVDHCVNVCARSGDTVVVPAGSATWTAQLDVHVGITLQGAGMSATHIAGANAGAHHWLIQYGPNAPRLSFRVTGFDFDITEQEAIFVATADNPTTGTVRIDHNRFRNTRVTQGAIQNWGAFGVIDHNVFEDVRYPLGIGWGTGTGEPQWASYSDLVWGGVDSMVLEDNTFRNLGSGVITDADQGGRYVARYNDITPGVESYPVFDVHGGRPGLLGAMGAELYGNRIVGSGHLGGFRGGRTTAHHNLLTGGGIINVYVGASDDPQCPAEPYLARQQMNGSYHFANRASSGARVATGSTGDHCSAHPSVMPNVTYWEDNGGCTWPSTCTSLMTGVGCGPLSARPASCVAGTAYWATDQSCTDLTGMVGVSPETPIDGVLYVCRPRNTWVEHYRPLPYPHPLVRADGVGDVDAGALLGDGGAPSDAGVVRDAAAIDDASGPPPEADAGHRAVPPSKAVGGCGCRATERASAPLGLGLLLGLLACCTRGRCRRRPVSA